MNVFVAYGYNDRDSWIQDLVFPLIRAFRAEVVTGEELAGEVLSEGVKERISSSDALIAFVTRRGNADNDGVYKTHRWVTDELAYALQAGIPAVEVRETGVDDQGGIAGDRQRIPYDETSRDRVIVQLAQVLARWSLGKVMNLRLIPSDIAAVIRPLLRQPGFTCTYTLVKEGRQYPETPAMIIPREGSLYITAKGLPPGALMQIRVIGGGKAWSTEFVDVDSLNVELREE